MKSGAGPGIARQLRCPIEISTRQRENARLNILDRHKGLRHTFFDKSPNVVLRGRLPQGPRNVGA
jgi:hypothetical protein